MSGKTHHQHTVQRALISGFAEQGRVCMMRRGDTAGTSISVKDAMVVSDFYSYKENNEWRHDVEVWIAKNVESQMGGLLPQMRSGVPPTTQDDREVTQRYLALCILRTPAARRLMEDIDAQIAPLIALDEALTRTGISAEHMSDIEFHRWLRVAGDAYRAAADKYIPEEERRKSLLRTIIREGVCCTNR